MTDNIDFLYHYTNIETLALILSNHTFRFRSLDQMDDLQEKETSDLKNVGQFCFISSWTDDSTESIPMWNMYSSLHSGVRIKLATNPFKKYANTPDSIQAVSKSPVTDNSNGNYIKSIITVADMIAKKYICPGGMSNNILHKVVYTSNPDELYPKLVSQNEDEYTIAFGDGPNDVEMLQFAGTVVAMGNAIPAVKQYADMVTDKIDEDGLYHAFERLHLLG